jgi:hypothetical protein
MRHELLGVVLLIIAAFLTVVTCNGLAIFAMFFAGLVLCCCKHMGCHKHHDDGHCHSTDDHCDAHSMDHEEKQAAKKTLAKAKK